MSKSPRHSNRRTVLKNILVGTGAVTALPLSGSKASDVAARPQAREVHVRLHLDEKGGPLNIDHYGVGHGGYWDDPTWLDRVGEVGALKSKLIRLFVQEYYNLLPEPDRYNWEKLDQSVDMILRAGAKPLMCLTFKPKVLFPKVDADAVNPTSWSDWEKLIYNLVRHYHERGAGIRYWEVGNEGDIGPGGALGIKIQDHPALRGFPHDGFPDLQFYNLLEGGSQFRSQGLEDPTFSFVPIISGINMTRERNTNALAYFALLFEAKVGAGKLLLTTLNIRQNLDDAYPEAVYLIDRLLHYAASDEFNPQGELSAEHLRNLVVPYVHRVHSL